MRLADFLTADAEEPGAASEEEDQREMVRRALFRLVSSERIAQIAAMEGEKARAELEVLIQQAANSAGLVGLPESQLERISTDIVDSILGLGPLEDLLNDPSVTEIMVNGPSNIFFERNGAIHAYQRSFASEDQLRIVIDRVVSPLGRRIDEQQPLVDARLPQGHRVNAVIPPIALNGPFLTIRKFKARSYSLSDMVFMGSMSLEIAQLLVWAVLARKNIAVSGGTGGGKTTLLNALSQEIPHGERIVTIEDSAELRFDQHPHVAQLEARRANAEGNGEVTIRDLVVNALRMRPDRIIVGECRGAEALDMLQAMNTGHEGSLTTLHASSPAEVVSRLVMMVRYGMDLPTQIIEMQIASALHLIVQQDRVPGGRRRVTQIAVRSNDGDGALYEPIVLWDRQEGRYVWQRLPEWVQELAMLRIATSGEVEQWVRSTQCCW